MPDTRDESSDRLCELHGHVLSDNPDQIDAECPNHVCQRCGFVGSRCSWHEILQEEIRQEG